MPFTVECFSEVRGESLWRKVGETDSYGAAGELFDEVCVRNEGCAVILRGEIGEVVAKRSVMPAIQDGGDDDGS